MTLTLKTKEDLESLHRNQITESSSLEYKASAAVDNADGRKAEIAKDVAAMANANGGQIIYGMTERDHLPAGLDVGVSAQPFNGLWFEQVIQQNVRPVIEGLKIHLIPAGNGNNYVVLNIPASKTVHQVKDGRYYRRRNFRNDIMEDYEVREAMNRSTTPEPFIEMSLPNENTELSWLEENTHSAPIALKAAIGNRSVTPAFHTYVGLYLDGQLVVTAGGGDSIDDGQSGDGYSLKVISFRLSTPGHFPLFKEKMFRLGNGTSIAISQNDRPEDKRYRIAYEISTPGYSHFAQGYIIKRGNQVSLRWIAWDGGN